MRVVITGGSGHLGMTVAERAVEAGHDVYLADLREPPSPWATKWFSLDVTDAAQVREVFSELIGYVPGTVIHLAGTLGTAELWGDPAEAFRVNTIGAINVLHATHEHVGRYLGVMTGNPWTNPYTLSKLAAATMSQGYHQHLGTATATMRVFNIFGPGTALESKVVPRFIRAALAGDPMPVIGTGTQTLDLIYIDDVADAFVAAIDKLPFTGEVIDVGSGGPMTVLAFAEAVWNVAHGRMNPAEFTPPHIERLPARIGEGPEHPVAVPAAAANLLGVDHYAMQDRFLADLAATIEWYREQAVPGFHGISMEEAGE